MLKSYADYNWPMKNPDHRPFKHQIQTTEFLLRNKRAYVLSDIGTGKTLSSLWATDILLEMGVINRVLVIAPLISLRLVWGKELFTNFQDKYYYVAHGTREECRSAIASQAHYIIINHDAATHRLEELSHINADVLIIDELTAFKNISADRHKNMRIIAKKFKAVWGLTGAPTPNSPLEAYGQARIVNPNNPKLPKYFGQYKNIVVTEVVQGVFVPTVYAQSMVYDILQPAIRFTRDECLDIPPVMKETYNLSMTQEQTRLYNEMKNNLYAKYDRGEITAVNAGVNLMKLLQISAGAVYDDERLVCLCDAKEKYGMILETFEELGRTKLIVVAAFVNVVERLSELLNKDGIRAAYIHGGVSQRNRDDIINSFQDGDLQILVLQPQTVSHALTLTASNTIIWHSYIQSGEVHLQMNGRITRAGQTRKQFVKYLTCSKAEEKVVKKLEGKQDQSDSVLKLFANREL